MPNCTIAILILLCFGLGSFAQPTEKWGDQGNGTYANPLIPADYSDIDAIRVGDDYYAISSTFQFSPGVVILHSTNLVNWRILGHVVDNLNQISPALNFTGMNLYGRGIWAGSIRYHAGKFWVYFGTPDDGFFMSTATNPAGPWQPLHQVWKVSGWDDCCPFWDDDGQGYFIATNFKDNYKIHLFKMAADGKQILFNTDSVIHQSKGSEANKLYKFNGLYYHFFSEVKAEGRVTMMGRAENIYGPYQTKQLNHVSRKIDKEPNQGGLIEDKKGAWWFFTHQGTGDWEGRAACLLPVTWINGWPIIGNVGADTIGNMVWKYTKPIAGSSTGMMQTNDEFNSPALAVQWEWNYQPRNDKWSLATHKGFLRLHAFSPVQKLNIADKRQLLLRAGNTITQRSMRTKKNVVLIKIDITNMQTGQFAGLCHFSKTSSSIGIQQQGNQRMLVYENDDALTIGAIITQQKVWLRSTWNWDGLSQYAYSLDGRLFIPFGQPYQLAWGFYRGDRIGIFNYNVMGEKGFIEVDWFHYNYAGGIAKGR